MPFHIFRGRKSLNPGERMVAEHGRWLSWALHHRRRHRLPRIPVRKVSEGGFTRLMATPRGKSYAAKWWDDALERVK